jgi:eukaryotic-like serine/threonine-protein kinase
VVWRNLPRARPPHRQEVAIKRLQPQLVARQPEVVSRFLREGDALSQLSHPNIVPMLAFYESEGQYNLVMEYMPGGTLRDRLEQEKRLPWSGRWI